MKIVMVVMLGLVCTSCALPSPAKFSRGEVDQKQFDREAYECERDARNIRGDSCTQMDLYETCMRSKGYTEIPNSAEKGLCTKVL
jgi:hypothetical protein